jgi:small-conductance mechanosensitive channel
VFEALIIFATFLLVALALAWLLRTIIEQKRWSRLSRTQSEVHNKILDRFGTSEELLAYVRTPAGTRFLESAPIPLHAERPAQGAPQSAPLTRVLWSIQIGVVVAVGSLGMLLVSIPFDGEGARALFVLGAIGFCVGVGFVASAAVSLVLSRRLGLWEPPGPGGTAPAAPVDSELVG